jgi:predicted enzyme related to lactoylglutathione lyase
MPARLVAPLGAPCWTDLFTSDVEGSRRFYSGLFGWEALEPSPEFGGYFMFARDGVPVAGGMGDMGDVRADNSWKLYLATDDIARTVQVTGVHGGQILAPAMPVADLGVQSILTDPSGAVLGAWQADTFPGFTVIGEPGSPSWFELYTRDYAAAVEFYRDVFQLGTQSMGDTDEFRYTTLLARSGGDQLAGIMEATSFLPEGVPAYWITYWEVSDVDATIATALKLGGSVVDQAVDTPYGRMATLADTTRAQFKLRAGE